MGGTVEISVALLALEGGNPLRAGIEMLSGFSSLVSAPIASALPIAKEVYAGIQKLVDASNAGVHLVFSQSFVAAASPPREPAGKASARAAVGGNTLMGGFIAVVLADRNEVNPDGLSVKESRLYYASNPNSKPELLEGFDYMLLKIEGRDERDDWLLTSIDEPLKRAQAEVLKPGALTPAREEELKGYRAAVIAAAYQSPDLTLNDRRRVIDAIKQILKDTEADRMGAIRGPTSTLAQIISTIPKGNRSYTSLAEALSE
jgi:hypothetical protein